VTYAVTDNQAGDSNTGAGVIGDPFAPMVLLAPAGVTGVPTLSQWGLMLMSVLVGLMAWRMRRVDLWQSCSVVLPSGRGDPECNFFRYRN